MWQTASLAVQHEKTGRGSERADKHTGTNGADRRQHDMAVDNRNRNDGIACNPGAAAPLQRQGTGWATDLKRL
ncbi:hypothetical protein D3C86_1710620 [compost metagenome]